MAQEIDVYSGMASEIVSLNDEPSSESVSLSIPSKRVADYQYCANITPSIAFGFILAGHCLLNHDINYNEFINELKKVYEFTISSYSSSSRITIQDNLTDSLKITIDYHPIQGYFSTYLISQF